MSNNLIWQQNSSDRNNGDNLKAIANWWSNLAGKKINWQQRLIPADNDLQEIDWQPQKFDETFVLQTPQLRGITLFWRNEKIADERNITPSKLQLDLTQQQLYIFPQSQSQVAIKINVPELIYQKLDLVNPQIAATIKNDSGIILLRDVTQKLEIKVILSGEQLNQLLNRLKTTDN